MMSDTAKAAIAKVAGEAAKAIGRALGQNYRQRAGCWWLYARDRAMRPLGPSEVAWHEARGHAPFVPGGITQDDPRWFDDPPT